MEAKLDMVLEQVGRDKNIDKSVLISALEQAILTAAKRTFGMNREMEAKFNPETGSVDLFLIVNVVDEDDAWSSAVRRCLRSTRERSCPRKH
jgi:N utilization substance protein A